MPDFNVKIRRDYRDMDGLILDCRSQDVNDVSEWVNSAPPARVYVRGTHVGANNSAVLQDSTKYWEANRFLYARVINVTDGSSGFITANTADSITATLSGGTDNDWDTGDEYIIYSARFSNPTQSVVANQPSIVSIGGYDAFRFTKSSSQFFNLTYPTAVNRSSFYSTAIDFFNGASVANNQTVLDLGGYVIRRRNGAGNLEYEYNATPQSGVGDMTDGVWLFKYDGFGGADVYKDNSLQYSGTFATVNQTDAGYIGFEGATTNYLDGDIRHIAIWDRPLSDLETDFLYQTFSPAASYNSINRQTLSLRSWTDNTDLSNNPSRLNFTRNAPQVFTVGESSTGTFSRIQIACSINGIVTSDSFLGGDLYDMDCIEYPGAGKPAVFQDANWSGIFDVVIEDTGHYTFDVWRPNHGRVILHFDAEVT